jgi:hypothetical protein
MQGESGRLVLAGLDSEGEFRLIAVNSIEVLVVFRQVEACHLLLYLFLNYGVINISIQPF